MSHKNYKDLESDELVEIVGPSKSTVYKGLHRVGI